MANFPDIADSSLIHIFIKSLYGKKSLRTVIIWNKILILVALKTSITKLKKGRLFNVIKVGDIYLASVLVELQYSNIMYLM